MQVTDLKKRLDVEVLPVYFLKGADDYLKDWAIRILVTLTDDDFKDFNVQYFEDAQNMSDIIAAALTVPVFASRRVIVVKSSAGLDDGDKSRLESYLKAPSDFTVLVISVAEEGEKAASLASLFKYGEPVLCDTVDAKQFVDWISSNAKRNGTPITDRAIRLLGDYTGRNMTRAVTELSKLYAYADGADVTAEMVETLVTPDNEYKTYALTNALTKGNNTEALKILQSLLDKGESAGGLLSMILAQYRRLLEAKVSSLTDAELAKALNVKDYAVRISKELAQAYTPVELKRIVDGIHALEYAFKSGEKEEMQSLHEAFALLLKKN